MRRLFSFPRRQYYRTLTEYLQIHRINRNVAIQLRSQPVVEERLSGKWVYVEIRHLIEKHCHRFARLPRKVAGCGPCLNQRESARVTDNLYIKFSEDNADDRCSGLEEFADWAD